MENLEHGIGFRNTARLRTHICGDSGTTPVSGPSRPFLIGVLEGSGVGPRIIASTLRVLRAVEDTIGLRFEVRHGGPIGEQAEALCGQPFPDTVAEFCSQVFDAGGAILSGPGASRYVYDLRRRFDLFCKFVPVRPWPQLVQATHLRPAHLAGIDMLIVRDNVGGAYQGKWRDERSPADRFIEHSFSYTEQEVRRLLVVAARAAASRSGRLHVIIKDGGLPAMSALWRDVGLAEARNTGVAVEFMNVDLAAYELIQNPGRFDVIATPNLCGDILADLAGILLGSRGVTFSGNFNASGAAVYQTNHGCAHDLADKETANPAGQILSLTMLLRESFGLDRAAALIERALAAAWEKGWRTADLAEPDCRVLGTMAMADRVAEEVARLADSRERD